MRIAVTGAAGFIGHHLVRHLDGKNHIVRAIDCRDWPYSASDCHISMKRDLRIHGQTRDVLANQERVFALAAQMGGIGYITEQRNQLRIQYDNILINLHTGDASWAAGVDKLLFTSSVCVYPVQELVSPCPNLLTEEQAIPANPQDSYGWEKLYAERFYENCRSYGLETRIVRLENTYGPECAWDGGKEKAPAALCRKIATAKLQGKDHIEIWGDGEQRRTFMHIDDCVRGLVTVMESDEERPVNLGPDESVSIDDLADLIMEIAGVDFEKRYVEGAQGVRGRNFSHERARSLGWEAKVSLKEGMAETYKWVETQVANDGSV